MIQKLLIIAFTALPFITNAQIGVLNKVKYKINQRADNKVDKAIDVALDQAEGKETSSSEPAAKESAPTAHQDEKGVTSFSRYDFIAGEQVVYYDNFDQQTVGELPTGWNTNGTGEVV